MKNELYRKKLEFALKFISSMPERMNASMALELVECNGEGDVPSATYFYEKKLGHTNQYDGVHGGIISALIDTCSGVTASAFTKPMLTTTDLSISYLRAMKGEHFHIKCMLTHVGKNIVNTSATIYDVDTGKAQATGMASFYVLPGQIDLVEEAGSLDFKEE